MHILAALAWLAFPALWPWWIGAILLNHAALTIAGLWPRSTWLGENWRTLPETARERRQVALTIDDGPDPEVTPAVLAILNRYAIRATFFCIGERARAHPELIAEIVAAGHAVENHSYTHRHDFSLLGPWRMLADLDAAQRLLTELTGTTPGFFRAPAGLRNPFLEPLLARRGLRLVSWTRRGFDTREGDPRRVLARLERGLIPGAILLLHEGNAARTAQGRAVILEVLPAIIERLQTAGLSAITLREAAR